MNWPASTLTNLIKSVANSLGMANELSTVGMNLLKPNVPQISRATFAAGCFWGVEAQFGAVTGVLRVKSGYTGGTKPEPTYYDLGDHTEAVEIDFDPTQTSYSHLLDLFFTGHDPTSYFKRQYMSAIYYHDDEQKKLAQESLKEHEKAFAPSPIVTKIVPASCFYDAEDYHQKYYLRNIPDLFKSLKLEGSELKESYVATKLNGYIAGYGKYEEFVEISKTFGLSMDQMIACLKLVKSPPFKKCH